MRLFSTLLYLLLALVILVTAADPTTTETTEASTTAAATTESDTTATSKESSATSAAAETTTTDAATTTDKASTADDASTTTTGASASKTSASHLSDLPDLPGNLFPTVGVPDLSQAPFMQKSTYPQGTVFICVGAILGFLLACTMAWRGLIAYSLHRSVKRAAMAQSIADNKAMARGPGGGMYGPGPESKLGYGGSTLSLGEMRTPAAPANNKSSPLERTRQLGPSASSLFFSPTADMSRMSHYSNASNNNRSSSYLPSGYYAATAAPGTLSPATPAGRTRNSYFAPSPPDSPNLPPSSRDGPLQTPHSPLGPYGHGHGFPAPRPTHSRGTDSAAGAYRSTSELNLSAPPQQGGRTPSAYLDDLFDEHGHVGDVPAAQDSPGRRRRY
ncbi:uncharacterized protein K452DRAFT_298126 [Aplosporella prunicola CBS 121167]|uniref:Csi2 protein n=1 Tax=Aplosporella prunicola CBS 121167 TaxID=1176127 RepID=A0A6A6BD93_9PEZI|nr:uncharacterized protein K452DRAFT_298126 [Aplosporella prunicola CBS 121167]KAF2142130.1 hypothetical protein K452DRAFT_298126 [Aplosporella prunicola CBS 121167]